MDGFAAPSGPPPPKVPDGWKAVWNEQYNEWFYVNIHTKQSQWDRPTEPAYAAPMDGPNPGAPPGYDQSTGYDVGPEKSNNPYMQHQQPTDGGYGGYGAAGGSSMTEDEKMARRLQEEEAARAQTGSRGHGDQYYGAGGPQAPNYNNGATSAELPPREGKKGLLSKLSSKLSSSGGGSRPHGYPVGGGGAYRQGYPSHGYGGGGGYGHQPMYGQPMHGGGHYGGHPGMMHGGGHYGGGHYGGGYGHPQRKGGGGMGMAGGAALGLGAGMIGGAMIADGMNDNYEEGYEDGGGGDDGGGDDGGGE